MPSKFEGNFPVGGTTYVLHATPNYDKYVFMKQYVIDQLRPADYEAVKAYLNENYNSSVVAGIYWIPLDQSLLTEVQVQHTECQPFYFAVDLEPNFMASELLIRTKNKMRCSCMSYANVKQIQWIIQFTDAIFEKLGIKI